MGRVLKIGVRPSALAVKQAEEVLAQLPQVSVSIVKIETRGDRDKVSPLSGKEESDFFTDGLEQALLKGEIDAAIHSAKDLEEVIPEGLILAAMTLTLSPFECLVSRGNLTLDKLPPAARVGTSSRKRKEAVISFRPDLLVQDIRGNIDERIEQLDSGKFDAIIVAHAALIRLGYRQRIAQIIPQEIIKPHPLQGRIAVQVRKDRHDLRHIFKGLDEK